MIAVAGPADHFDADPVFRSCLRDGRMLNLHRINGLLKIRRMP